MKAVTLTTRPQRRERIIKQEAEGTAVLLSMDSGDYYSLEEVGVRVWELCNGRRSVLEIAAILGDEYDAAAETIQRDLIELLDDLRDENLVDEGAPAMGRGAGGL
jgi:hypothetical protein